MRKKRTTIVPIAARKRCATLNCKNNVRVLKGKPSGHYCNKCIKRKYAKSQPLRYAYDNLRNRAKQRNVKFTITFEYYKKFCEETGYAAGKGRKPSSLTIDRIKVWIGYEPGNLQVLTKSDNSAKMHEDYANLPPDTSIAVYQGKDLPF